MCSLNESEYDTCEVKEMTENTNTSSLINTTEMHNASPFCKKCGSQEVQVFSKNRNEYCKVCFLNILKHKFRATLGKSKSICPNDSILVAHSGKANSTALLHLIMVDMNESIFKKFRPSFKILYIDDGMVKGRSIEERKSIRNALANEAKSLQLTTYVLPLSKCTNGSVSKEIQLVNDSSMSMTSDEDTIIQEMFDNLENDTARDELLQQLRRKLLISAAGELNCDKIFIADISFDLALKVLGNVSTGRGSQLPFNVALSDTRHTNVTLLRPLRDFTQNDITNYLDCYNLHPIFSSDKYNFSFPISIRNITRHFVHKLDSEFYGTVSTIYRTSEKLATKIEQCNNEDNDTKMDANIKKDNNICILCELTLDSCHLPKEELSVVQAKLFSKLVSTTTDTSLNKTMNSLNICEQSDNEQIESLNALRQKKCHCQNDIHKSFLKQSIIEKYLCYGCRLIFLNSKQVDNIFPKIIFDTVKNRLQVACLQEEIRDLLL
ncbi:cytosolic thiouridylase subunit 2 [Bombus fervidus]|uniref:cytosolic thiouridylase subunit 2 n=1 Tax=Bombus fervidus TaxID=203811 RepID=UPI003AB337EC